MAAPYSKAEQAGRAKPAAKRAAKPQPEAVTDTADGPPVFAGSATEIPLAQIVLGRNPRVMQSASEQKSLVDSIKTHGVLQPIRVRMLGVDKYELIAGSRRYAAAKSAKLKTIPAVVAIADDSTAFVQALIENIVREDLNPLDEAKALQTILTESGKTQQEVGEWIGRSQSYVANSLRLLELAEPVKEAIESGKLSASHGKAMASLPAERQIEVAKDAVENKRPSKEVEERIRRAKDEAKAAEQKQAYRESQFVAAVEAIDAKIKATRGLTKKSMVLVFGTYGNGADLAEPLTKAGFNVVTRDKDVFDDPEWSCEEQKTTFEYSTYGQAFKPVCLDVSHKQAFVKVRDAEKQKLAKEATKKVDRARSAAYKALRTEGDVLNVDGQRLVLYRLLTAMGGYGDNPATAFVKRHVKDVPEGETVKTERIDVWAAIRELDEKQLGTELTLAIVNPVVVNVFGEANPYGGQSYEQDWFVRSWLVEQFGLDADVVFGTQKVRFNVIEDMIERGMDVTPEQRAEFDRVTAERASWQQEREAAMNGGSSAVTDDPDDDEDEDDESDGEVTADQVDDGDTAAPETVPDPEPVVEPAVIEPEVTELEDGEIAGVSDEPEADAS